MKVQLVPKDQGYVFGTVTPFQKLIWRTVAQPLEDNGYPPLAVYEHQSDGMIVKIPKDYGQNGWHFFYIQCDSQGQAVAIADCIHLSWASFSNEDDKYYFHNWRVLATDHGQGFHNPAHTKPVGEVVRSFQPAPPPKGNPWPLLKTSSPANSFSDLSRISPTSCMDATTTTTTTTTAIDHIEAIRRHKFVLAQCEELAMAVSTCQNDYEKTKEAVKDQVRDIKVMQESLAVAMDENSKQLASLLHNLDKLEKQHSENMQELNTKMSNLVSLPAVSI